MKKTNGIQLVLITAALAGCDKPLYQQGPEFTGPVYPSYEASANGSAAYGIPPYGAAQAAGAGRTQAAAAQAAAAQGSAPGSAQAAARAAAAGRAPIDGAQLGGERPDSGNSCPMLQSGLPPDYYLWYEGLQPFNFNVNFANWYPLESYYSYHYPATIIRYGFGRTGHAHIGFAAHS